MIGINQTAKTTMTAKLHPNSNINEVIELFRKNLNNFKLIRYEVSEPTFDNDGFHVFEINFYHTLEIIGDLQWKH